MTTTENGFIDTLVAGLPEGWVPPNTFAARLTQLRDYLGLTIEQIAPLGEVSPATWSNWERGMRPSNLERAVAAISRNTRADARWLLTGETSDGTVQNLKEMKPTRKSRNPLKDRTRPADTRPQRGSPALEPAIA